jgi:uncharacterized protein
MARRNFRGSAMSEQSTRLISEIDFDADGKYCGFLRLPHSVHRSAYGWLPIPLVSIRNGTGPTVLLMAGTHGDEYEGQVTLSKLVREIEPEEVSGRVIVLPMANFPAALAGLRTSPIDGLNLNRVYPGAADGSPTLAIAHYVESVLMPLADYSFDLHSGGSSLLYPPTVIASGAGVTAGEPLRRKIELARVFGAPYMYVFPPRHGGGGTSGDAAARNGVVSLETEMGGAGTVSLDCQRICEAGTRRLLRHVGVWHRPAPADEAPPALPRVLVAKNWHSFVYAPEPGLFEPLVRLGEEVEAGQPAARLHSPETPWRAPVEVRFEAPGVVACQRFPGRSERGDCLFHLGEDRED